MCHYVQTEEVNPSTVFFKQRKSKLTSQKMKFFITGFFSKFDQIRRKLWIWSHLLKKSVMKNFIFCAVAITFRINL